MCIFAISEHFYENQSFTNFASWIMFTSIHLLIKTNIYELEILQHNG